MTIPDGPGTRAGGELVGQRLGGYVLLALLGAGGMAEVYRARELALGREVAVKVLPAALARDSDYVRRFRTEAKRFAALDHPHIVPVYHFDVGGPLLYLVMPLLKESLRDRLVREGRLDPDEAIRLVSEVASALEAAHAQGLVHRDVKPENVLLDDAGKALLTDFGIARDVTFPRPVGTPEYRDPDYRDEAGKALLTDFGIGIAPHVTSAKPDGAQTLSGSGLPVGTPEYMAPEQLRNEGVDQRSDIYALGAMLYELLTGRAPHEAETPHEVAALVLMAHVMPPSAHTPHIWPALERVVLTALAYHPEERYADAASFAAALREAQAAPREASAPGAPGVPGAALVAMVPGDVAPRPSLRPIDLDSVPDGEIDKVPTLPPRTIVRPIVRPAVSARVLASLRQRRVALLTAVALLALAALGGGALAMAGGLGSSSGGGQTSIQPGKVLTATIQPSTTAAALVTAIAQGTPGAPGAWATATALATQTPQPTAAGTPQPTPPNTPQPTATPVPSVPLLSVSPVHLVQTEEDHHCTGSQVITNTSGQTLGWQWQSNRPAGLPSNFTWGVGPTPQNTTWPPQHGTLAGGSSDQVAVSMWCTNQSYTLTLTDSLGRTSSFTLTSP